MLLDAPVGSRPTDLFDRAGQLGHEWKFNALQRALIEHQIRAEKEGVESVASELSAQVDEFTRRLAEPQNLGIVTARHEVLPTIKDAVVGEVISKVLPGSWLFMTGAQLLKAKADEPDRFVAFIAASIVRNLVGRRRLWDRVHDIWGMP